MYDQFSQAARKAFQIANQEAIRSRHEYIGCEHILLGILAQGDSVVEACESLGVPAHRIRWEIESLLAESTSRPEAPPAKKVVEFAIEESPHITSCLGFSDHRITR
jgi:ATP-dependent Clp protease ATP-binding subunit ClpC